MKLMLQIAGGVFLGTISAALVIAITASLVTRYQIQIGMQQAEQEIENMERSKPPATTSPATEKVWIPGQSIQTCMHGKRVLNAAVLQCRDGYFITVPGKR
ncbi:MAG: hypothetical protein ACYDB9_06015 [Gammaproteobacteria bacterium]